METAKRVGLDPKQYFRYAICQVWHGKKPLSPLKLARQLAQPPNKRMEFRKTRNGKFRLRKGLDRPVGPFILFVPAQNRVYSGSEVLLSNSHQVSIRLRSVVRR